MFSPLDTAAAPSSSWRRTLKASADKALAFLTLEGYDTDDVAERLRPGTAADTPDLLGALRLAEPAAAPARLRPTDPHAGAAAHRADRARRSRARTSTSRRSAPQPAAAACTSPVTPGRALAR